MSNYKYNCPTNYGYKKIKLTKQQHKAIFKRERKHDLFIHRNYYKKDDFYKCEYYTNKLGVILETIINIPYFLWDGGIKEIVKMIIELPKNFKPLKYGKFYTDETED